MNRTVDEILDDLHETGAMPSELEVVALCKLAAEGEQAAAKLDAFELALNRAGWSVVDTTTDDDEGTVIELVPPAAAR